MPALPDRDRLKRRCLLYARRGARMVAGKALSHPCLFMHLPKCGGTSLAAGLYATVRLQDRIGVIDALATRRAAAIGHFGIDDDKLCHEDLPNGHLTFALREAQMVMHMAWGSALIHGHVLFPDRALQHFGDRYRIVTMMRDPEPRALSNYRMAVRAGVIAADLDAWLDGPMGTSMTQVFLRYLSGRNVVVPENRETCLAQAAVNLRRIALIGFLDDLPLFTGRFAQMFGQRPVIPHYNAGSGGGVTLRPDQKRRLEVLCQPDQQLYALARTLHR